MPINELLNISDFDLKTIDGTVLKKNLSINFSREQILLISGPNGSGKTTLIHCLLKNLSQNKIPVEYVPQLANIESSWPLTIEDVLALSLGDVSSDDIQKLGLIHPNHLSLLWNTASGGERKRTLLTRAILLKPQVLVLDEPFNHLDHESTALISFCLGRLIREKTLSGLILVSHQCNHHAEAFKDLSIIECSL